METICAYLKNDHERVDTLFDQVEANVAQCDWKGATDNFCLYRDVLRQHIVMEEKVLLPAFEQALKGSAGPVAMLRTEHRQIHALVDRMGEALQEFDATGYLLHAETLTLLMQQHAVKEEEMLYPLLDKVLASSRDKIIRAMAEFLAPGLVPG